MSDLPPCIHGHPITERIRRPSGELDCRACRRERTLARYQRLHPEGERNPRVPVPQDIRDILARRLIYTDLAALSERTGIKGDRLVAIADGTSATVRTTTLDRLVVTTGLMGLVDVFTGELVA
ncbi:hypothetical protein ACT3SZ_15545 [Corynebacterium sp. AOP40-9SA-29]|uniref:hypothetical protein n=1 Tax=Corynebacterium sp. AOP40-9SA-29 TaxID=3457677 RepID=UPI004033F9DF